jgi:hypothetical protein
MVRACGPQRRYIVRLSLGTASELWPGFVGLAKQIGVSETSNQVRMRATHGIPRASALLSLVRKRQHDEHTSWSVQAKLVMSGSLATAESRHRPRIS